METALIIFCVFGLNCAYNITINIILCKNFAKCPGTARLASSQDSYQTLFGNYSLGCCNIKPIKTILALVLYVNFHLILFLCVTRCYTISKLAKNCGAILVKKVEPKRFEPMVNGQLT